MIKNFLNIFKRKSQNIIKEKKVFLKKEVIFNEITLKVLDENQKKLKPLLEEFSTTYFLAGGTAIALYLGHRKSIDFDFFSDLPAGSLADFLKRISKNGFDISDSEKKYFYGVEFLEQDEIHTTIKSVKFSIIN